MNVRHGTILHGTILRFGNRGFGFIAPSGGRNDQPVFFHLATYRGRLSARERDGRLANPDLVGQEVFFVPGPGREFGQTVAQGWSFVGVEGDNHALLNWRNSLSSNGTGRRATPVTSSLSFGELVRNLNPTSGNVVVIRRQPRLMATA